MEIRTITIGQLEKHRVATIEGRLIALQAEVKAAEQALAEGEALTANLQEQRAKQEENLERVRATTAKRMKQCGLGPKASMASVNPAAAEREFEQRLRESSDVQEAIAGLNHASAKIKQHSDSLTRLQARQQETATTLERFIAKAIGEA